MSTAEQPVGSDPDPAAGEPAMARPGADAGQGGPIPGDPGAQPSEEQLRAAYAAELSRVASADMVLQAAASLLNIGAYRLGLLGPPDAAAPPDAAGQAAPERDLEQVRDAIDAVRGLLPVIERSRPQELLPLRQALSQLQMAYAQEVQAGAGQPAQGTASPGSATGAGAAAAAPSAPQQPPQPGSGTERGPGPAESSGRLWVPGR